MNKNVTGRPNRVVTCQVCGVKMPQRYLADHMKGHEQVRNERISQTVDDSPEQVGTPAVQNLGEVAPEKESPGTLICPACAAFVTENIFPGHMLANHSNWCPLCNAQTKDLTEHLRSRHLLKPISPPPPYERSWETQKRFICLGCKKKVSVWSYPKHAQPHGATSGLAQQKGVARTSRELLPPRGRNQKSDQK